MYYYCIIIAVCVVISKESEHHHSIGSLMDRPHPSPKTERDHPMKDHLGRYCLKTFETAKGKKEKWCRWELNWAPYYAVMLLIHIRIQINVNIYVCALDSMYNIIIMS